jgi:hypothetical protein
MANKHSSHFRWRRLGTRGHEPETYQQFIERRFWGKVEKTDGCWLWTAGTRRADDGNCYGQFYLDGKNVSAHRMALMLSGTYLRDHNDVVAHRCDNPRCVRPDHLFVTTNQGNTADRHAKGRTASHARNGNAKLSDADVERIRESYLFGAKRADLVALWDISNTHVGRLISNKMRKAA